MQLKVEQKTWNLITKYQNKVIFLVKKDNKLLMSTDYVVYIQNIVYKHNREVKNNKLTRITDLQAKLLMMVL